MNKKGEILGEISELVLGNNGKVKYAVLAYGGFFNRISIFEYTAYEKRTEPKLQ